MAEYHARKGKGKGKGKKDEEKSEPEEVNGNPMSRAPSRWQAVWQHVTQGFQILSRIEHQPAKHGVPDYADDPAYSTNDDDQKDAKEYTGPLPEASESPSVGLGYFTPHSHGWLSWPRYCNVRKGKAGSAVLAPYHLMRYCTDSVACKWRWRQTVAILAQATERDKPLLGTTGRFKCLVHTGRFATPRSFATHNFYNACPKDSQTKMVKWKGPGYVGQDRGKFFDTTVETQYEGNLVKAFWTPMVRMPTAMALRNS